MVSWTGGVGSETAQMWIRQLKKKKSKFKDSRVRDLNETRAILYSHLKEIDEDCSCHTEASMVTELGRSIL